MMTEENFSRVMHLVDALHGDVRDAVRAGYGWPEVAAALGTLQGIVLAAGYPTVEDRALVAECVRDAALQQAEAVVASRSSGRRSDIDGGGAGRSAERWRRATGGSVAGKTWKGTPS